MGNPSGHHIATALAHCAGSGAATARQIAAAIAKKLHEIEAALAPIIGRRGVVALYRRSLHLSRPAHPWLAQSISVENAASALDIALLESAFAQQTAHEAAAAGGAILQTFHDVLTHLIGASLTERLLRSVWATFLSGDAVQDNPT